MSEYLKTVTIKPPFREIIGRDIEVRLRDQRGQTTVDVRGSIVGIQSHIDPKSGETTYILAKVSWVAELTTDGWKLFAESPSNEVAVLPTRWFNPSTVRFIENPDGTLSHFNIAGEFIIHSDGDNLRKEDLISP